MQTGISEELLGDSSDEVSEEFFSYIHSIPFIQNLIASDRRYAKDMPRDSSGKIIIDFENPHILEDMDYFRPSAIHYQKYGCYTKLKPNSNPNSEYGRWIREEVRRCYEGYVRPSDGEWVTGDYYFFLNYCPMTLNKQSEQDPNVTIRVVDFPHVWDGHYLKTHYLHRARYTGKHYLELASRGKGKSALGAALLAKRFVLGESSEVNRKVACVATASEKKYLTGADQLLVKFQSYIDFTANATQFPSRRITSSLNNMQWTMGYIDVSTGTRRGTENTVSGVTSKDDESKLRGTRGVLYIIEEAGTFPRLLKLFNVLRPSVEDGGKSFGIIVAYGTSGDSESDFSSMQEMMYNPLGYNILHVKNVFDKANSGKPYFSFFFAAYLNKNGCYDKNGNSDVTKALLEICEDRYIVKYNSTDPYTLLKRIAEYPIVPKEAILNVSNTLFPVNDLTARLSEIDSNPSFYDSVYTGNLNIEHDGGIVFKPTSEIPIRFFPHKENKLEGSIEFFSLPEKGSNGKVFPGRYIGGVDPYNNDQADTMSLGTIFILDLWTDTIVCEYTGRPTFADDFFETCRKIALFYNARLNYENNLKGLFSYFQRMNCLYLLTDTLEFLRDKQLIKATSFGNTSKGTNASAVINNYARTITRDWLLKPVTEVVLEDGEEIEVTRPNLYKINNRALLQELISYNDVGNFDRISALGMLMLLREDRLIHYGNSLKHNEDVDKDYLGNDAYFNKNFK